jgi:hypothetical protein
LSYGCAVVVPVISGAVWDWSRSLRAPAPDARAEHEFFSQRTRERVGKARGWRDGERARSDRLSAKPKWKEGAWALSSVKACALGMGLNYAAAGLQAGAGLASGQRTAIGMRRFSVPLVDQRAHRLVHSRGAKSAAV